MPVSNRQTCLPCRERILIDRDAWRVEQQLGHPGIGATKWREGGLRVPLFTRQQTGAPGAGSESAAVEGIRARLHQAKPPAARPSLLSSKITEPALTSCCRTHCSHPLCLPASGRIPPG